MNPERFPIEAYLVCRFLERFKYGNTQGKTSNRVEPEHDDSLRDRRNPPGEAVESRVCEVQHLRRNGHILGHDVSQLVSARTAVIGNLENSTDDNRKRWQILDIANAKPYVFTIHPDPSPRSLTDDQYNRSIQPRVMTLFKEAENGPPTEHKP